MNNPVLANKVVKKLINLELMLTTAESCTGGKIASTIIDIPGSSKIFDRGLVKIKGNEIRSFGFPQLSIAVDLHGDIFLFREAGFLNRQGNEKVIIGRLNDEKNSLENNIKNFLRKNEPIKFVENDSRFLDSFDHVLNALVNQAEEDEKFGIPLNLGPIAFKNFDKKESIGNNWYSDDI